MSTFQDWANDGRNAGDPTFSAAMKQKAPDSNTRRSIPLHGRNNDNGEQEQEFLFDGSAAVNPDIYRSTRVTDAKPTRSLSKH